MTQRLRILCQHRSWVAFARSIVIWLCLGCLFIARNTVSGEPTIGLPFTKSYSLEEIGAFRGAHIGFDRLGRLSVISEHSYIVLNDNIWMDIAVPDPAGPIMLKVVDDGRQKSYYGALASWGVVDYTAQGKVQARPLRPETYPDWILSTNFTQIVTLPSAVIFAGTDGLVYLNKDNGEQKFIEFSDILRVFTIKNRLYVSSHIKGTFELDLNDLVFHLVDRNIVIDKTAELDNGETLVSTTDHRLAIFDGKTLKEWHNAFGKYTNGSVSGLLKLPDNLLAVTVEGKGLYILTQDGQFRFAAETSDYKYISNMASNESGVVWLSTETSVNKLYYTLPVSIVDQRSGVAMGWPLLAEWRGRTMIASIGQLYELIKSSGEFSYQLSHLSPQPPAGAWAMSSKDDCLLLGNSSGLFMRTSAGYQPVVSGVDISRIVFNADGVCLAIGKNVILALKREGDKWVECAPRANGIGFPSIIHETPSAIWLELGMNRIGRVWFGNGGIHTQVFDEFPWKEPSWVNIGSIGNTVILSGPPPHRVFFDEETGTFVQRPAIDKMLSSAPFPVLRIVEDKRGVLWATKASGAFLIFPTATGYRFDTTTLQCIHDRNPIVELSGDKDTWIVTESSLYHTDQNVDFHAPEHVEPFIVSIADSRTNEALYSATSRSANPDMCVLPYSKNHLQFRFFGGNYSILDPCEYLFTISDGTDSWTVSSTDSLLTLPNLPEGRYHLKAELLVDGKPIASAVAYSFIIRPPWFRSILAYVCYVSLSALACFALVSFFVKRARRHQLYLENLVRERTEELRSTMDQLTEEARNSATLEERNRLAGEIHDSIQQGLSGLILQLDSTLRLPALSQEVESRLSVARRMVSFTRAEVQQTVWNLESPLLNNAGLEEALRAMADLISARKPMVEVHALGSEPNISSAIKHHLLRIAQEAITNAVRHSGADSIVVKLDFRQHGRARIEVVDNGKGFDPAEVFADGLGHFGLRGQKARAAKINASLNVISSPDKGTTVRCDINL